MQLIMPHLPDRVPRVSTPLEISTYISGLSEAELHVHLQGAASVATVLELARTFEIPGEIDEHAGQLIA
jgi:adenosine deaminase